MNEIESIEEVKDDTNSFIDTINNSILQQVKDGKITPDIMSQWLDFFNKIEDKKAKKNYLKAFSLFQSKFPAIPKNKEVWVGGKLSYKYADLDEILKMVKPILSNCGLSIRFLKYEINNGRATMPIELRHEDGYFETSNAEVHLPGKNKMMNPTQEDGAAITYAKRYALCSILALNFTEDIDGVVSNNNKIEIKKLENKKNSKKPTKLYQKTDAKNDKWYKWFNEKRKKFPELEKETNFILKIIHPNRKAVTWATLDKASPYIEKWGKKAIKILQKRKQEKSNKANEINNPFNDNFYQSSEKFGDELLSDEEFINEVEKQQEVPS